MRRERQRLLYSNLGWLFEKGLLNFLHNLYKTVENLRQAVSQTLCSVFFPFPSSASLSFMWAKNCKKQSKLRSLLINYKRYTLSLSPFFTGWFLKRVEKWLKEGNEVRAVIVWTALVPARKSRLFMFTNWSPNLLFQQKIYLYITGSGGKEKRKHTN